MSRPALTEATTDAQNIFISNYEGETRKQAEKHVLVVNIYYHSDF